jgi:hypothetical protein
MSIVLWSDGQQSIGECRQLREGLGGVSTLAATQDEMNFGGLCFNVHMTLLA